MPILFRYQILQETIESKEYDIKKLATMIKNKKNNKEFEGLELSSISTLLKRLGGDSFRK